MSIHVGGRRSGISGSGDLEINKSLVFLLFFSLLSEVYAVTVEWSLISPYQLAQSRNNWYATQPGESANIDLSKGGQIAFVPAPRYGLYNRAYPQPEINLYLPKSKHSRESSSEEHNHKKNHHRDSSEVHPYHEPTHHHEHQPEHHEHHPEHRPEHHKSAKEELNDEHAEQAEISAGIAGELNKLSDFMKSQISKHIELRDQELKQGNEEAAKKEQIIIDLYQDQIKYLDGIEKVQEAIMVGEAEMYADDDGAGQKHHGHDGHHGNGGDHKGHGNQHHHGNDDDKGHHGHDGNEGHGHDHHGDHANDHDGHGKGHHQEDPHEKGEHAKHQQDDNEDEDHHRNHDDDDDEFYDTPDDFEDDDDEENDPDYEPNKKHKLDRRSPFSFLPSLPGSSTATVDNSVKTDANVNTSSNLSSTPNVADVSATASATATTTGTSSTTTTPTVVSPDANTNSGWLSMFGFSNNAPVYSPYTLLKYMSPSDTSPDNLKSLFNVFSDPSNSSYLSNASTLMRVVMFFMPGTGIVDQVYFTMALSKIMWEAATMYYDGYGNGEIAVVVLGELAEAAYLSRRGEESASIISQKILTPGDIVKIDGMDVPAFLKYIKNMKYPDLTETQETKLRTDIDNLLIITYPNISPELKTTFMAGIEDSLKFLALFNVEGDLYVKNVDVNFSEVYIKMHSAFDDSPLEKIKKTILGAIDAIKSNFN